MPSFMIAPLINAGDVELGAGVTPPITTSWTTPILTQTSPEE